MRVAPPPPPPPPRTCRPQLNHRPQSWTESRAFRHVRGECVRHPAELQPPASGALSGVLLRDRISPAIYTLAAAIQHQHGHSTGSAMAAVPPPPALALALAPLAVAPLAPSASDASKRSGEGEPRLPVAFPLETIDRYGFLLADKCALARTRPLSALAWRCTDGGLAGASTAAARRRTRPRSAAPPRGSRTAARTSGCA